MYGDRRWPGPHLLLTMAVIDLTVLGLVLAAGALNLMASRHLKEGVERDWWRFFSNGGYPIGDLSRRGRTLAFAGWLCLAVALGLALLRLFR